MRQLAAVALGAMLFVIPSALASHTPAPTSVTIAGSLQAELGCPGDWQPDCAATHLAYDGADGVWQATFPVPAGNYEYKAPLNDAWTENYGANATRDGANIALNLASAADVKFYYDHATHWVTSSANSVIATAPGSFQSELGCPGDWQPDCLRSWLQDPDGDGTYSFRTDAIPAGNYEVKVAIGESWGENYGAGGVPNGPNIPFTVTTGDTMVFSYDAATHVLTVSVAGEPVQPTSVAIPGSFGDELGCAGDWDPGCPLLAFDATDRAWQGSFDVPAGNWEYKAALNGSWDENYGANATRNGPNLSLSLAAERSVKFYYSHATHWITSNANAVIATAPGSYQSELGCPDDWQPDCLRSWLQDPDGNGIYEFETRRLPAGNYEVKVAIDESWAENYGAGGVRDGANIAFSVATSGALVKFSYDAAVHVLTVDTGEAPPPGPTNRSPDDVEWGGLRHDSRDTLYRTPGGSVQAGTDVLLRLRTLHDDVTAVKARIFDSGAGGQHIDDMHLAAQDVSCYDAALAAETCDYWEVGVETDAPNVLWYRFIVTDGNDTDYYADNTSALDGGLGTTTDDARDWSYALTSYDPQFSSPAWARDSVVYQIFPDRFRNGDKRNDPRTGDVRYDDPVLALPWGTLPEGYCRNYAVPDPRCPWRYDSTPPDWSPNREGPRGRDYMGGDLQGIEQKLDYLQALGIDALYLNPVFAARSNHRYDTADYTRIDPYLGDNAEFAKLVRKARERGIRVVLDGVFNHMSSDSPFFDRYGHYPTVGACESLSSPFRSWFVFNNDHVPCGTGDYVGWFGFDSIPQLEKTNPAVLSYFVTGADSIAKRWLRAGAGGWRMDVSSDPSFPAGYWEAFRQAVKTTRPDALTIAEAWQKDTTTLRSLVGDRFDSTMNYRQRDAILGFLTPHSSYDSKGFADSGRQLAPSEVASRLASIREDYPDAAYYSLLNLLDSHDTERIRWALTPGPESREGRELDSANLAQGKRRQQLASLMQFTLPGMPSIYYGDEAGMTGDDDPDDRRTFPWPDTGGRIDAATLLHYGALVRLRDDLAPLRRGSPRIALADDAANTLAYSLQTGDRGVLVAFNRGEIARPVVIGSLWPEGTVCRGRYGVGTAAVDATVTAGKLAFTLPPLSGLVCATDEIDLQAPPEPENLRVTGEGNGTVSLAWDVASDAAGYRVYRSYVRGGGYQIISSGPDRSFSDSGLRNATTYYYVVRSVDAAGNESGDSNEVQALPHLQIGWANLQWPPSMTHVISTVNRTDTAYGQVWIDGVTNQPGATPSLMAQLGFGPDGTNPAGNAAWQWVDAAFNVDAGNNDEFKASLLPDETGTYDYAYRYSTTNGRDWVYADLDGIGNGYSPAQAGSLTVVPSSDTTAPPTPSNLRKVSASPTRIEVAWDSGGGDTWGYEVRRGSAAGGPYTTIARVRSLLYADADVDQGATYYYVVRAIDSSFNRSGNSNEIAVVADLRMVSVVFTVEVPTSTDATGKSVYIAGTLHLLSPPGPEWNPGGQVLERVDATHWRVTLTGLEGTQLEYKYTLGSWDFVEKGPAPGCAELSNRQLTLAYGTTGTQNVSDTVANWRNVAPCGN